MYSVLLFWLLWCIFHSLLLQPKVKDFVCSFHEATGPFYRIAYIVIAVITLLPIVIYTHLHPQQLLFDYSGVNRIVQATLLIYGVFLFYLGTRAYDMDYFLGFQHLQNYKAGKQQPPASFRQQGILHHIRHPWYSGGIALLWGMGNITNVTLGVRLLLTGYFILGTLLEERRLKKEIGRSYQQYCRNVPMLFPWKWIWQAVTR